MPIGLGYNTWVGIGEETTYGQAGSITKYVELNSGGDGITLSEDRIENASVYGIYRPYTKTIQGNISVSGSLTFDMRYEGFEKFLLVAFGTCTTTSLGSGAYQHKFTIADQLTKSLTLQINKDLYAFNYLGMMINSLEFKVASGGFLTLTVNFVGKDVGTATAGTPTFPTAPFVIFSDGAITYNSVSKNIKELTISINNNLLTDRRFIGSRTIAQPLRGGKVEVTGSFSVEFESLNEYNDFRNATVRSLVATFTSPTTIGTSTIPFTLELKCNSIRLTSGFPKVENEGIIKVDCPFKAYATSGTQRELEVTLKNSLSSI
ncbi:MAG: phage tail tube protein [Candidatus Aenigmatarchaeota archaeon]